MLLSGVGFIGVVMEERARTTFAITPAVSVGLGGRAGVVTRNWWNTEAFRNSIGLKRVRAEGFTIHDEQESFGDFAGR